MTQSLFDELSGTNVPPEIIIGEVSRAENRLLGKLVRDFSLTKEEAGMIILALYRFKKTYREYVRLLEETNHTLTINQRQTARIFFLNTKEYIDCDSRRCFSNNNLFGKIRCLLHTCHKMGMTPSLRMIHLKRVCNFRVIVANSIKQLMEDPCWPTCLPHVYVYQCSGLLTKCLKRKMSRKQILTEFRRFIREQNVSSAHTRWFNRRFAGSYGSRQ